MCDFSGHTTFGGTDRRIPLLKEVYDQFPDMPVNIDIKVDSEELIQKVTRYLRPHFGTFISSNEFFLNILV